MHSKKCVRYIEDALGMIESAGNECVRWPGPLDRHGYGRAFLQGQGARGAHRLIYELAVGPIPEGMTIDHKCFVTDCVNPKHLQPETVKDNCERQRSALRSHCINGHEFTEANTYQRRGSGSGKRQCRACNRNAVRALAERKRVGTS